MGKRVLYSNEGREKLKKGIDILANAVKVTLGPRGRNVVIKRTLGGVLVTKDGVTVAREIELEDELENLGADIIKDVAGKTADYAGDGTTTATVLAQKIYSEGMKLIQTGHNPIEVKEGMDLASSKVCEYLNLYAKQYTKDEELIQVATVSSNNDEVIGRLVGDAFIKVGKNGLVTMGESKTTESFLKISEGLEIDRGYISPYFINQVDKDEVKLDKPYIVLINDELTQIADLLPVLNEIYNQNKSFIIIAKDVKESALQTIVVNKLNNNMKVAAVRAPGYGDAAANYLQDIAVATGGIVMDEHQGTKMVDCTIEWLGRCDSAIISAHKTVLLGVKGSQSDIRARVNEISSRMDNTESDFDKKKLQERMSKLGGSACTILIGGNSEIEVKEKKDRVEDAMNAVKSAIEEGLIAGGGTAYYFISKKLSKFSTGNPNKNAGIKIVVEALKEPFKQIMKNGEYDYENCTQRMSKLKYGQGIDARTGKVENLIDKGIIDPVKVAKMAIQNAVSIVGTLLTTECVVY